MQPYPHLASGTERHFSWLRQHAFVSPHHHHHGTVGRACNYLRTLAFAYSQVQAASSDVALSTVSLFRNFSCTPRCHLLLMQSRWRSTLPLTVATERNKRWLSAGPPFPDSYSTICFC